MDKVLVYEKDINDALGRFYVATLIKEYPHHFLIDVGKYRKCINKADIKTEDVQIVYI